jgi:transmembrane sensor
LGGQWWAETERDPMHLAAADWLVRLQNPEVSLEETLAWQTWMNADPRHAQAFERVESVSELMREVCPPRAASSNELSRDAYDASVSLKEWRAPPRFNRAFAVAASLMLLSVGLLLALYPSSPLRSALSSSLVITTLVGENRTVSLADGSTVTLGGNTQLSVSFDREVRYIALSQGEALFTVAKDARRPFKVHTSDATVVALGTQFNVRRGSDRSIVSVTEGRVVVEPTTRILPIALVQVWKPTLKPVQLDAGEQTMAGSAGIEHAMKIDDLAAATSWQNGQLEFRMERLRYVLEDVNRYAPKAIVLEDDGLGDLVITGMVSQKNIGGWIESLERSFGLRALEKTDRIVLTTR